MYQNQCYLRILSEFREMKQPQVKQITSPQQKENNMMNLFNKQFTHRKMQSEHCPKIPKLKFEYTYSKNSSPRFRIKNLTPISTARSARTTTHLPSKTYLTQPKQQYFKAIDEQQLETMEDCNKKFVVPPTPSNQLQSPTTVLSEFQSPRILQRFDFDQQLIKERIDAPKRTKKQLRMILLRAINKLKAMNIDPEQMIKNKVFSKKPYQRQLSQEFIHAVKLNQMENVILLLEKNRYLVFDFDYYNMTGLHWACKKGLFEMCEFLVKNHADVDAVDILHRTPLYLAIQGDYLQIVELLLKSKAYPWSTYQTDLVEVVQDNRQVQKMLTFVRRIDIINTWGDKKVQEDCI